jgi:hypothetical protein
MGWLDWLGGGVEECPDCVWLSADAKWKGIAKTVELRLGGPDRPTALLVTAHFPQTLRDLRSCLQSAGIDHRRVQATTVEALLGATETAMGLRPTDRLEIVAVERHFLPDTDARLRRFAQEVPCRCRLTYHLSLEDPLLRAFSDHWVERVLRQMGMTEEDALQSSMVSRRIRAAQQKFARRVDHAQPADSAQEWLRVNAGDSVR